MIAPIRVATAALSERIFAGRPTKDGKGFKEPRYDVTSDVLVAIRDKIGIGHEVTVECDGVPAFRIAVLPAQGMQLREDSRSEAEAEGLQPGPPTADAPVLHTSSPTPTIEEKST